MAITALLTRPMTLVRRASTGTTDPYGNQSPSETSVQVVGELQQQRRTEPGEQGEFSDTQWLIVLPADIIDVTTGDLIICDSETYELVGDPWRVTCPRTGTVSHMECTARRTSGADDEVAS